MENKKKINPVFIAGKTVNLCPLDPEGDLVDYMAWMNDQETTRFMDTGGFVTTRHSLVEYIQKYNVSKNLLLGIFPKSSGQHVGNITLHMFDYQNRIAEIGIVMGDKASRGQGFASEAIRLVLQHAFMKLNMHKVCSGMVADNLASKLAFERSGFKLEGTLRKHFFLNGKYIDCYRYGILEEDFFNALRVDEKSQ